MNLIIFEHFNATEKLYYNNVYMCCVVFDGKPSKIPLLRKYYAAHWKYNIIESIYLLIFYRNNIIMSVITRYSNKEVGR